MGQQLADFRAVDRGKRRTPIALLHVHIISSKFQFVPVDRRERPNLRAGQQAEVDPFIGVDHHLARRRSTIQEHFDQVINRVRLFAI